ncbi:hypothetical protein NMY22_g19816 [Coprinellus aureogranulatus]|nr:hypothetical protein NMY22_g19816 [Coprinellus aureogranulatus]
MWIVLRAPMPLAGARKTIHSSSSRRVRAQTELQIEGYDKSIILCVDAIDECKEIAALKDCLSSILSNKPAVPLKVFFTSRPELAIKQEVEASSHSLCCESLGVDNIGKDTVRADIALYVSQELKKVRELEEEYGERWPPPEVEKIVEQSDSLFVIAATIVRDICSDSGNPVERLQECGRAPKLPGVRELYDGILSRATANLRPPEKDTLRSWLSLLVVSFKPLTLAEYAALLDRPVHAIQASFKMLHSVIKLPSGKDDDGPISTHHASFASFLTRSIQRSEGGDVTPLLPIDIQTAHAMTFECCLRLMNDPKQSVHPGIPEGVISCKSNTVPLIGTPRQSLPAGVAYACMFLLNHYLRGLPRLSPESKAAMTTFIEEKGLYWFRALTSGSKKVGFSGVLKLYDVDKDGDELRAVTNTLRGLISRADPLYIDHPSCTASEPVRATITQGPDSKTTRVWIAYESTPVMPSTAAICSG